jgi:hypothetical protein
MYLRAFTQILIGDFSQLAKYHHPVPFGLLLHFAGLPVMPLFSGYGRVLYSHPKAFLTG